MTALRLLPKDDYWALMLPFDTYLPDSVPAEEVKADLASMQSRFRAGMSRLGSEGSDWEFPGHYQHVRVLYVYIYSPELYRPELARLIETTMEGFDTSWVGRFECFPIPVTGGWAMLAYHKSEFMDCDDGENENEADFHLARALGLELLKNTR